MAAVGLGRRIWRLSCRCLGLAGKSQVSEPRRLPALSRETAVGTGCFAGFLHRTAESTLRFPAGLLEAVAAHLQGCATKRQLRRHPVSTLGCGRGDRVRSRRARPDHPGSSYWTAPQSSSRLRPVDRRLAELLDLDPEKVRAKVVDDAGVVENASAKAASSTASLISSRSCSRTRPNSIGQPKRSAADRARDEHRSFGDLRRHRPGMGGRGTRGAGRRRDRGAYSRVVSRGRGRGPGVATSTPFER